jgi:hypothetical protein
MSRNKHSSKENRKRDEPTNSSFSGVPQGFCMLRPNNLYKFMEDLKIVIGKEYPRLLHIIDQRKYVEPPEIPAPHPNSLTEANDTGGKNMLEYKTRIVERIKAISQVANDKSPMFNANDKPPSTLQPTQ